jgi:hypothetical protein
VADPATGAWVADPYNLDPSNPFEVVGGTSLSAPAWAGLIALANQGRAAAAESTLNTSASTDDQQALYILPQSDYNEIDNGSNGYEANAGYNLVTGLGTPVANLLVPDLVAYEGPGTVYRGPAVLPLQDASFVNTQTSSSAPINAVSIFDALKTAASFGCTSLPAHSGVVQASSVTMTSCIANPNIDTPDVASPAADPPVAVGLGMTARPMSQLSDPASVAIFPLNDSIPLGTLETPVQNRSLIRRAPARFAVTPRFRSAPRSPVTDGTKTAHLARLPDARVSIPGPNSNANKKKL